MDHPLIETRKLSSRPLFDPKRDVLLCYRGSILKVLVMSDTHVGYKEKDPVRGEDSFLAFEECLKMAQEHSVWRVYTRAHAWV